MDKKTGVTGVITVTVPEKDDRGKNQLNLIHANKGQINQYATRSENDQPVFCLVWEKTKFFWRFCSSVTP